MEYDNNLTLPIIYNNNENRDKVPLFQGLIEFYETHFVHLVNSLGYGIIIDGHNNLIPKIESNGKNIRVTLQAGAFLDKEGRLILIPKETAPKSFNIEGYRKIYFYLKSKIVEDDTPIYKDKRTLIKNNIFDWEIVISPDPDDRYIEVCRVELNKNEILYPKNPFAPKINEIDMRFVPKIISNNSLPQETKDEISEHLYSYGDFFTKLAPKIGSFSASVVASESYHYASKIRLDNLSTFDIYNMLSRIISTTTLFYDEIKDKNENIKESYFEQKIKRLQSIFSGNESITTKVSYYDIDLHEGKNRENFWENIFSEIRGIYESNDPWNLIKSSITKSKPKEFLLVGRKGVEGLDIEIDSEWVSGNHLKITKNDLDPTLVDIEDLGSANGTYLKGIRYENHKKVTVNRGEKIELYDYEFDIYNNPVVKEFLESNN